MEAATVALVLRQGSAACVDAQAGLAAVRVQCAEQVAVKICFALAADGQQQVAAPAAALAAAPAAVQAG